MSKKSLGARIATEHGLILNLIPCFDLVDQIKLSNLFKEATE